MSAYLWLQTIFAVICFAVMLSACRTSSSDEFSPDLYSDTEGACYSSESALIFVVVIGVVVFVYTVTLAGLEAAAKLVATEQLRDRMRKNANTGLLIDR